MLKNAEVFLYTAEDKMLRNVKVFLTMLRGYGLRLFSGKMSRFVKVFPYIAAHGIGDRVPLDQKMLKNVELYRTPKRTGRS